MQTGISEKQTKRNYFYGVGTIGRDMVYSLSAMFLMFFLTDVIGLSAAGIATVTVIMMILRAFDAINDPYVGMLIDNTHTKFGKFKPWLIGGSILSAISTMLLFQTYNISETKYIILFTVLYLFWGLSYTAHDISYWSMLPSLSAKQTDREKIGSIAKICANIGIFTIVVGIVPITKQIAVYSGSLQSAYGIFASILSVLMLIFLFAMCIIVKEDRSIIRNDKTQIKEILSIILKNDQLIWIIIATFLFNVASTTTTSLGLYYFKYVYGNEDMYSIFAAILGVSQIFALLLFPLFSKRFGRKTMYGIGTCLVSAGYLVIFFAKTMPIISIGGVLTFFGEGFIQMLMLMFIADCVEYGELKFGKRNDSITLSVQPFVYKMSGALAAGFVGLTVIICKLNDATGPADVSASSTFIFKCIMLIVPLFIIVLGYIIYRRKFIIDEEKYAEIIEKLHQQRNNK